MLSRAREAAASPTALGALGIVLVVLAWLATRALGVVDTAVFPSPFSVVGEIPPIIKDPDFRSAMLTTCKWWASGLVAGVVVGTVIGLFMGRSRRVFLAVNPVLTAAYATPKVALIVPVVLLFGINTFSMASVSFLGALVPVTTSAYQGALRVNVRYVWSASALGTRDASIPWQIILPASLPDILSGTRVAIGFSLLNLLGGEFVVRQGGVGAYLFNANDVGLLTRVWAIGLIIGVVGFLADLVYEQATARAFRWSKGQV